MEGGHLCWAVCCRQAPTALRGAPVVEGKGGKSGWKPRLSCDCHLRADAASCCAPRGTGLSPEAAKKTPYIASMGIYVFKKSLMLDLLDAVGARWAGPGPSAGSLHGHGHVLVPGSLPGVQGHWSSAGPWAGEGGRALD